jgi:hypothetical protein
MDWRDWFIVGTVVTFAGGQISHAYTHPLDSKQQHDDPRGIYTVVRSTGNLTVVGSGTLGTTITPGTGTLTLEGGQGRIV